MDFRIVFSDVDGTLLDNRHRMLPGTLAAIRQLQQSGISFVIVSGRYPCGIYSIQETYGIRGPIIAYGGALIRDANRNALFSLGFSKDLASEIMAYIDNSPYHCTWNLFSGDTWLVKDCSDYWVKVEEEIVQTAATEGTAASLPADADVHKILCMCEPDEIDAMELELKSLYPALSIVKSSDTHLEVMQTGVTKSLAVRKLCQILDIPLASAIAFGDHFNDQDMLEIVGMPFLMENAPDELKKVIPNMTASNEDEGIYRALVKLGIIS